MPDSYVREEEGCVSELVQRGAAVLGVDGKELKEFVATDTFNNIELEGVICRRPDHRYGALVIFRVGEEECEQLIFCTPKLHYPFDKKGTYYWPDVLQVVAYDKLDGTNVLAYHYFSRGKELVTYKSRLTPVLCDTSFGPFVSLWKEYLEENSWVQGVVSDNPNYNLSFELFGFRNAHAVNYAFPLAVNLLFGVGRSSGNIVPPDLLRGVPGMQVPAKFGFRSEGDLTSAYSRLRGDMSSTLQRHGGDLVLEGMVLYADVGEPSWRMFKCKPEEIERIHWAASGFIPKNAIYATALNAYEDRDDPTLEYVVELLREEFDEKWIMRSMPRVNALYEEAREHMTFAKKVGEAWKEAKEKGFDITLDKGATMRFMSDRFSKSEMRKVGAIVMRQAGLVSDCGYKRIRQR